MPTRSVEIIDVFGKSEFVELNWILTTSDVVVEDSKSRVNILTERYGFFDIISSFFYNY